MKQGKRTIIQAAASVLQNMHLQGFWRGQIYQGKGKLLCVPGLNCYSCPGALGSCPVGALQAVAGGQHRSFSFYAVGLLLLFGVTLGRLICGFLCPFGLIQDLLYKLPTPKLSVPEKPDKLLRYGKYLFLLMALTFPVWFTDFYGIGDPFFCKYICPAGTLEGGLPLLLKNEGLRKSLGWLFGWKAFLLFLFLLSSMLIYRPFCRYVCPLGALYGLMNRVSLFRMELDRRSCIGCGACERICPMKVEVLKSINSPECIRCGRCESICPRASISYTAPWRRREKR